MTAYIRPAYYHGPSLCKLYENQSCLSSVGLAFARFEKLLAVIFVISLVESSLVRRQALPELVTDKLALLDQHLRILHGYGRVSSMLEYCMVFLVYITSRFPLNPDTVNVWFDVPKDDPDEDGKVHIINLDAVGWKNRQYSPQLGIEFPNRLADERHKLYFHGTSHEAAVDIMNNGIDLSLSTKRGDFSNGRGFYVFDEFKTAFEWAGSRYNKSPPAVLVFRVDKECLGEYKNINLCDDKRTWESVVRTCRSGNGLKGKEIEGIDFIEGPTANISGAIIRPVRHSYQMCILSDAMTEDFEGCLHSIVFRSL